MEYTTSNLNNIALELLDRLNEQKHSIIEINIRETGYNEDDLHLLWADLESFLLNCHILHERSVKLWAKNNTFYRLWEEKSKYIKLPWGKVLVCIPGNSIIPLLPIIIVSFCSVGNKLVIAPSRKVLKTVELILDQIHPILIKNKWEITFFKGGGKAGIDEFIGKSKVDLLYFQGSSKNRVEVYARSISNGIDVIFEGEGNQVTLIDEIPRTMSTAKVAKMIWDAKMMCKGQLCTSPNFVFINERIATPLIEELRALSKNYREYNLHESMLLINKENFSKTLNFAKYSFIEEIVGYLKSNYNYGLQISIFGNQTGDLEKYLLRELNFSRLTVNMNPTIQNSLLPWGGYAKSGYSPVVNFFEKATKNIIIEYGKS